MRRRNHFLNRHYLSRAKYSDAEHMEVYNGQKVRKLTAVEIEEFRAHINRRLDPSLAREPAPIRRSVV